MIEKQLHMVSPDFILPFRRQGHIICTARRAGLPESLIAHLEIQKQRESPQVSSLLPTEVSDTKDDNKLLD